MFRLAVHRARSARKRRCSQPRLWRILKGQSPWLVCLLAVLAVAAPAFAQFDTASVVGTVRDASGGAIPGATVTLTNTATGVAVTKTSNSSGAYEFITVRPASMS
jgi:hypothetical protein